METELFIQQPNISRNYIIEPVVPVIEPVVPVIERNDLRKIEKFTGYFVRTYFEGSCFPVSFWNHFLTDGPRTNNNIEGYNHRLKLFVGAANPNIYKVLTIFKNEETSADKSFRQACQNPPSKPPPRKNYFVDKDSKFKLLKGLLLDKSISLDNYVKQIIDLYKFEKKEKKTVEDSTDSESDVISETSNDSSSSSDQNEDEIIVVQNNAQVQVENVFAVIQDDDRTYFNL